jgi:glycosyltransferase involved in cell wall biosynthesis
MTDRPVDVVLPVLDEAAALPWVLGRMPDGYRPIVVDNGSTDGSGAIASEFGATVITELQRGFGAACATGLAATRTEIVAFMDCDGSLDPLDLPALTSPVSEDRADLVLGARRPERGAWPFHARLANRGLARQVKRHTGIGLTDLGPMRAARRHQLMQLGLEDRRFGWPLEMVLRAGEEGWRVVERPVTYRRRTGRSKVTGTVRGSLRAVHDMNRQLRRASHS